MTVTVASFRNDMPMFANEDTFDDVTINQYIKLAYQMLPEDRWGDILDYGVLQFVAHNVAIDAVNVKGANARQIPGFNVGPITGSSVGPVSVSYNTQAGLEPEAGHWGTTVYGSRLLRYARFAGMGPIQL